MEIERAVAKYLTISQPSYLVYSSPPYYTIQEVIPITKKSLTKITAPSDLSPDAQKEFNRIYAELSSANIATPLDIDALCLYCETLVEYYKLTKFLNKNGYVIEQIGDKKQVLTKLRPEAQIRESISLRLIKLQTTLGLNPTSRSRYMNVNTASSSDEESEMLSIIGEYPEPERLRDKAGKK